MRFGGCVVVSAVRFPRIFGYLKSSIDAPFALSILSIGLNFKGELPNVFRRKSSRFQE